MDAHTIDSFNPTPPTIRASTRLRQLLARPNEIVLAPGVYDGISARLAIEAGFSCLYATGAGMTASKLGLPDLAFAGMNDFVEQGGMIASVSPSTPVICDADTGFGGPAQIARTVRRYEQAGIAGFHIEDQVQSKRCGHLLGKQLVSADEFLTRIRAAVVSRKSIPGSDIVIIARTDAAQGLGIHETVARLKAAIKEGADVAFLEGVNSKENLARTVEELAPTPVLLNMVPGGATPAITAEEAKTLGVKLMIFPGIGLISAAQAIKDSFRVLAETGEDVTMGRSMGIKDFFNIMGLQDAVHIDAAASGKAYEGV